MGIPKQLSCRNHFGCDDCYPKGCKLCQKSVQFLCKNCKREAQRSIIATCSHEKCDKCLNTQCNQCIFLCGNCEQAAIGVPKQFSSCNHFGCDHCYPQGCKLCVKFLQFRCTNCNKLATCEMSLGCNHRICGFCFKKHPFCSKCPKNRTKYCFNCKSPANESVLMSCCSNYLCLVCFQNLVHCPKCTAMPKQDNRHGRCEACLENKPVSINACSHKMCEACITRNNRCKSCTEKAEHERIRCCCCENIVIEYAILDCKHIGCLGCLTNNTPCNTCKTLKRTNNYCIVCRQYKEKYAENLPTHSICVDCYETGHRVDVKYEDKIVDYDMA